MNEQMKLSIIEGIKEMLRLALIAIIPTAIAQLSQGMIDMKVLGLLGIIAVLRGIEKYLYVEGKETGNMNVVSKALMLEK